MYKENLKLKNSLNIGYIYIFIMFILYMCLSIIIPLISIILDYDAYYFIIPWMKNMSANGIWSMYKPAENALYSMDYPPLYYLSMFLTVGKYFANFPANSVIPHILLRMFIGIINVLFLILIYKWFGIKETIFTSLFLPFLLNIFIQTQSDVALIFLIYLMFYFYIEKENLTLTSITYALIACLKLQGLYILPIYLLLLFISEKTLSEKFKSLLIGVSLGFIIWLPFLIEEGFYLFFKIYLNIRETEPKIINFQAGNIHVLYSVSNQIGNSLYDNLNIIILLISTFVLLKVYKETKDIFFSSFFYLFLLFMISYYQHGRYTLYSVAMFFLWVFVSNKKEKYKKNLLLLNYKKIFLFLMFASLVEVFPLTNNFPVFIYLFLLYLATAFNLIVLYETYKGYKLIKNK